MFFEDLHDIVDGNEKSIFGDCLLDHRGAAVRAGGLLIGVVFEQFPQAGRTTAVLVHAHHHRRVLFIIELT